MYRYAYAYFHLGTNGSGLGFEYVHIYMYTYIGSLHADVPRPWAKEGASWEANDTKSIIQQLLAFGDLCSSSTCYVGASMLTNIMI